VKLQALTVDEAGAFDGHVPGVDGEDEGPVAVAECRVPAEGCVDRVILLPVVGAPSKWAAAGAGDVALQFDRADVERAGGHEHSTSAVPVAGIDCQLERRGIERLPVALRAVVADVIGARAIQRVHRRRGLVWSGVDR
jgi:hypothetical protein